MQKQNSGGQLLLEALIAIAVAAVVIAVGAQVTYVSLKGGKTAGDRNVALGLGEETLEAARSSATEKWQTIFNLVKNTQTYYPQQSSGKWVIATGTENVIVNTITYTRSFTVQNVCRDATTKDVTGVTDSNGAATTCTGSGGTHDPSTQKINVTVSFPDSEPVTLNEYLSRWRNKVCLQTAWNAAGSGTTTCPTTNYGTITNITGGVNLQLCTGGC